MTRERDNRLTVALLVLGGMTAGLGFIGILNPAFGRRIAGGIPIMNAFGIATTLLAAHAIVHRAEFEFPTHRFPDVRTKTTGTLAGETLDTALTRHQATARSIIRGAAYTILNQHIENPDAAIEDGSWTDDAAAVAFLSETHAPPDTLRGRIADRLTDTPRVLTQAEHAVAALLNRLELTIPDEDIGPSPHPGAAILTDMDPGTDTTYATHRWTGLAALPLIAVTVAVFTRSPGPLLIAGVGVALVGAIRITDTPPKPALTIERRVDAPEPDPDQPVRVTLAVTNTGDTPLTDVRLQDGVPPALTVDAGTPTIATTLRPNETVTITYAVTAEHGVHTFDTPYIAVHNITGTYEWLSRPHVDGTTELACVPPLDEPGPPQRSETTPYAGRVDTTTGGQGVEFYSTREYRHGDPLARVDWNRLARTGDLTTINFRRERAASVVLLIDTRTTARVAPTYDTPHAVERSVRAARKLAGGLLDVGDQVGLATLGPVTHWTPPSAGAHHRAHLRRTLAEDPAFTPRSQSGEFQAAQAIASLRARLSEGTTIIFCTPLIDDWAASVTRRLAARTAITVVSPNPTSGATIGTRFAAVERATRISTLRSAGIPILDWSRDDSLAVVLARHARR